MGKRKTISIAASKKSHIQNFEHALTGNVFKTGIVFLYRRESTVVSISIHISIAWMIRP